MQTEMKTLINYTIIALVITVTITSLEAVPIISVPPVDTVGCYGGLSTFYCESDRTDIIHLYWGINGVSLTDEIAQLRGITTDTNGSNTFLNIFGNEDNNGIYIGCVAITSNLLESKSALFSVTDIPPVTDLTINFTDNGIMMCTWSQPSCLPVNYSYSISVNNVPMMNSTSTVYSMNISSCMNYTVSITVTDTQYQSQSLIETAESGYYEEIDLQLNTNNEKPIVVFHDITECTVTVFYKLSDGDQLCDPTLSFLEMITPLSTDTIATTTTTEISISELLMDSYNSTTGLGTYTIGPYNDSFIANYSIQSQSNTGTISTIRISTFNVQQFSISNTSNGNSSSSIVMECVFALNSSADGCNVHLQSLIGSNQWMIFISKEEEEAISVSVAVVTISSSVITGGYYTVNVFDVVSGVTATQSPAYTTHYSVIEDYTTITSKGINHQITSSQDFSSYSTSDVSIQFVSSSTPFYNNTTDSEGSGGSSSLVIVPSVVIPGVVIVTLIVIITGIVLAMKNRKSKQQVEWYVTQNPAYETVSELHMRRNRAYEVVTMKH